jgi:uncharacterized protein
VEDLVEAEPQEVGKMFFKKKIKKVHGEELLTCPRCNIKMEKLKKNDVIIDVCKKCKGMWLDAGEMDKLADMAQKLKKSAKKGEKDGKE